MPMSYEEIKKAGIKWADEKTLKNECSWDCEFEPDQEEVISLKAIYKCGHIACAYCRQHHIECVGYDNCLACGCKEKLEEQEAEDEEDEEEGQDCRRCRQFIPDGCEHVAPGSCDAYCNNCLENDEEIYAMVYPQSDSDEE